MRQNLLLKRLRTSILLTLGFLFVVHLTAAYIENLPITLTQPDGEIIECFASGDEFFNYAHTEEGYTIIIGADGYYYYGVREGDDVVPSEYRVNTVVPSTVGIEPGAVISERRYRERKDYYQVPDERNDTRAPHTGTMNNIVIYIRFSDDTEFTIPRTQYDQRFNNLDSESMRDYFLEVSYDQLDIISHHYPVASPDTNLSYQDTNPRSYYQPYHNVSNPTGYRNSDQRRTREHALLVRAVEAVRNEIPADMVVDASGDGRVDNVSFIIRGNSGAWADLLWAHRWALWTYNVTIHGKRVYDYTFQPENQSGISTLSHEMFHTLGAPDLYRYSHDGFVPVGPWDLMASGFVHMGAWMKYKYTARNWISEIPEINTSGTYTLNPLTSPENNSYLIRSPYNNNQFFILEYRRQEGRYESRLPSSGLLVYRINIAVDGNASGPPDEVYIYRPNGTTTVSGAVSLATYSAQVNRTEINDFNTNPTSFLATGSPGGLIVQDIGYAGETITFTVTMVGDLRAPMLAKPANNAIDISPTPTFNWSHINVADNYSLQIAEDSNFNNIIFEEVLITDTEYTLDDIGLLSLENNYYWRVNSSDDEETSEWSESWMFTVAHFTPLDISTEGASYGDIVWGDLNNNGFLDLVMTGQEKTYIYINSGAGTFETITADLPALSRSSVALGDINNSGYLDIVLTGRNLQGNPEAFVCINGGDFNFQALDGGLIGAFNGSIALGDYNNNGLLDILITGDSELRHSTRLYKNNGNNTFTLVEDTPFPGLMFGDAEWGDFNNNGKLDLLLSGSSPQGSTTDIYYNNGAGSFIAGDVGFSQLGGSSVSVGDYNSNTYPDVLVSGIASGGTVTQIYRNNGDGTFSNINAGLPGLALGDTQWGDFNNNGLLDLLITGSNDSRVFRNNDNDEFSEVISGLRHVNYSAAAWGDFDNDGDLDLAIIGSSDTGSVLKIYQNNLGTNEFTRNTSPTVPVDLQSLVNQCTITLMWDRAEDEQTPQEGITYNLSIGTEPGQEDYWVSMSDLDTGFRRIPARGNTGNSNEITFFEMPSGTYYWRVQAVDGSFKGSYFSEESMFSVEVLSTDDVSLTPVVTKLGANYPNPFNPQTTINFSLQKREKVSLEVFNILGQKIATLVSDELDAGKHSVVWNSEVEGQKALGSGVYLYRLRTDSYTATRKMLLLQ